MFNADADKKIIEDAISFYFMDADAPWEKFVVHGCNG